MNEKGPIVSAVIPTRYRAELVCRAVHSVLAQTVQAIECIVVIDGPDLATFQSLSEIGDARLRVIALEENVGGCEARNIGARAARGEWVALLDDDDEWLPHKLELQLAAAAQPGKPVTMVASRYLDRGAGNDDMIKPVLFPRERQPISEFLWCEVSCWGGIIGFPQTSTWMLRRDFLLNVPFRKGMKLLQDLDWLLRGYPDQQMRIEFVEEPLAVFHNDSSRQRVTRRIDWQYSRQWAIANRHLFTEKALGFFLVIFCVNPAAQQAVAWPEIKDMLREVRNYGKVTPKLVTLSFLYVCVYPWIARYLSPRMRSRMLYRLRSLFERNSAKAVQAG
jgi:glycosyltransferase involved in cell wall biosynthesis